MFPRYARDEYFRSERKTGKQNGISLDRALSRLSFARTEEEEGSKRRDKGHSRRGIKLVYRPVETHQDLIFRSFFFFIFIRRIIARGNKKKKKMEEEGES